MLRVWPALVVMLSTALLLTGCANLGLGTAPPAIYPGAASCVGGSGPTIKAPAPSGAATGIVTHGSCTVIGVPDTATVTITVQMQAITARAALDATGARTDAVIGGIAAKGVNPHDIRASEILVAPVLSPIISSPVTGVGGTRVTGFQAARAITATLHDIPSSAAVIQTITDSTGDSGAVRVDYSVSNDGSLRAQAAASAVHQAQDKAKQIAAAAGVTLGELVSITEVPPAQPVAPPGPSQSSGTGQTQQTPSSGIPSGNDGQELEAAVDVVYAVG
jgi:uncharacterized protein YggE